ncbi:MFS transporter [Nocardia transvalensis]|nr:MFS transporter [Nocardia transvalensis]
MPTALYADYARIFHLVPFGMTALFASYVAAVVPTMMLCGSLSDAWGRRRTVLYGLCLSAAGSVMLATAAGPLQLFFGRLVQGSALGMSTGATTAALADGLSDRRAAALAAAGISIGSAAGPLLSGVIAELAPEPLSYPFLVHLLLLIPAGVWLLTLPRQSQRLPWRPRRPSVPKEIRRPFAMAGCTVLLTWSLLGFFLSLAPSMMYELTPADRTTFAAGIVTLMLGAATLAESQSARLSKRVAKTSGLAALASGISMLMAAVITRQPLIALIAAVVVGVGKGLAFAAALAEVTVIAPVEKRGEVLTTVYLIGYLALAVPVLCIGLLAGHIGLLPSVLWFGAPTTVGCLILLWLTLRRSPSVAANPRGAFSPGLGAPPDSAEV